MQGEPEFERLKRELEEVKNAPRGLEGTFRTAAEMERHRAQVCYPQACMQSCIYSAALQTFVVCVEISLARLQRQAEKN